VKSAYHSPTAMKWRGCSGQIMRSTPAASRAIEEGGPTGTAPTSRAGPPAAMAASTAGGDAVVDHHDGASCDPGRGTVAAVAGGTAGQLGPLLVDLGHEVLLADAEAPYQVGVDHRIARFGDGADRQLPVAGRPQLAGQRQVEGGAEGRRHLGGHRDPAPRHSQHQHVGRVEGIQRGRHRGGEPAPGVASIDESHVVQGTPGG